MAYGTILAGSVPAIRLGWLRIPSTSRSIRPSLENRLTVLFRIILAIPGLWCVSQHPPVPTSSCSRSATGSSGVILGRVPNGMQTLGMFCLRFMARTNAYILLVNPRYPAFGDTPGVAAHGVRARCRRCRSGRLRHLATENPRRRVAGEVEARLARFSSS